MTRLLLFVLCSFYLLGCHKEEQQEIKLPDGNYAGTFQRENVWGNSDTANILMTFANNQWTGSSDRIHYPAMCRGTYSITGDSIEIINECAWTAEFNWGFIFGGKYAIKITGDTFEFTRDDRSATSDTFIDRYIIKRKP